MNTLAGLWAFPLTPFDPDGALAPAELEKIVRRQLDGGVDLIVALGVIAEVEALTRNEWREALEVILASADGRAPVLVTLLPGFDQALASAPLIAGRRVAGVVYLPRADAGDDRLADEVAEIAHAAEAPVIVYQRGALRLNPVKIEEALKTGALLGIKDSTLDVRHYRRLHDGFAGDLLFAVAWEDAVLPYWPFGVDSFCPASTAHDPEYSFAWYKRLLAGDLGGAKAILDRFGHPMCDLRLSRPGIDVAVVKAAMHERGLDAGGTRPPGRPLTEAEHAQVRRLIAELDHCLAEFSRGEIGTCPPLVRCNT